MVIWYGITSVILGVILYFPARKMIYYMMANRLQAKLKRALTEEELARVQRKAYVTAAAVAITFAFIYNRFIMRNVLGGG